MNLHEYQVKNILYKYGFPIPKGISCATPLEVKESIKKIGNGPWVIKCQVHAGGRAKSNAIKITYSKKEIYMFAVKWLGKRLITSQTETVGKPVNHILIEVAINIKKELYLSAVIDRSSRKIIFMASSIGGINIEEIAKKNPKFIYKIFIDPLIGAQPFQGRELACKLGLNGKQIFQFSNIFMGLSKILFEKDLLLIEINPLVISDTEDLICLDAKLNIDDNALFRQSELLSMQDLSQNNSREVYAAKYGLHYIQLDGNIGCMVNGAGLAMAIMDLMKIHKCNPANFLDIGGNITKMVIKEAIKIIVSDDKVKVILVIIFGGIICCDLIAEGIIDVMYENNFNIPIIVRFEGNNSKIGIKRLINSRLNIISTTNLMNAIQQVQLLL